MSCGKCGRKTKLCPVSLGIALGLTVALAALIWSVWFMSHGGMMMPMMPAGGHVAGAAGAAGAGGMPQGMSISWGDIWMQVLMLFIKGFIFGFVLALIYDCCIWIGKKCCRCGGESCGCCGPNDKNCSCSCHSKKM